MKHGVSALRAIHKQNDLRTKRKPRPARHVWPSRPRLWSFAFLFLVITASASTRPHYGGTVRVLIQHKVNSLDPGVETEYPADREKLASLVFETLTQIDAQGHARPKLAASWQAEAGQRIWQFQLHAANFHDG